MRSIDRRAVLAGLATTATATTTTSSQPSPLQPPTRSSQRSNAVEAGGRPPMLQMGVRIMTSLCVYRRPRPL